MPLAERHACLLKLALAVALWLSLATALRTYAQSSAAPLNDPVAETAVQHLLVGMTVSRDGRHNTALRALRHLEDPQLQPIYQRLARTNHPALRINGVLGMAEVSPDGHISLDQLAAIEDPTVQSEIITAALDDGLMTEEQARQLLAWEDLNDGVKLVILLRQDRETRKQHMDLLLEGIESPLLGRQGLAALMLADLDRQEGMDALRKVNQSNNPQLDMVRQQMLTVLSERDLANTAAWAYDVSMDPNVSPRMELLALREAMRQGSEQARNRWRERFRSASDAADRTRLAIIALESATAVPASLFQPMLNSDDPIITQMGRAGAAVANLSPDVAEQIVRLIEMDHPIANAWALQYANNEATPQHRQVILMGLILTAKHGDRRGMQRRLDLAVAAAQSLVELDPQAAVALLRPVLQERDADPLLVQAILYGVLRAQTDEGLAIVQGLSPLRNADARNLILLIRARSDQSLTERDIRNLGFLVQGAGAMPDTFRLQAAWSYLQHTNQVQAALDNALSRQNAP